MRYIQGDRAGGGGRIVWSASDLKAAAECEFAWLRAIDARLGRIEAVEDPRDATGERAAALGTAHEERVLAALRHRYPGAVVELPQIRSSDDAGMARGVETTLAALADPGVQVVAQAVLADADFVGFADFLVRDGDGRWIVQDTKLARHARVTALMQLAAYADQLDRVGIPRSERVELLLGDGTVSSHAASDLLPVFALRRARLRALIADRRIELGAEAAPIAWGDARGELEVFACGRCATCEQEVERARDLLLVAGMRPTQRTRLREGGIATIDALAAAEKPVTTLGRDAFEALRAQARLQVRSAAAADGPPAFEVISPQALAALPRRDPGDLFFDFEGDPLHTEGEGRSWGLDYLFGWVDTHAEYTALWAHSFAEERAALETFVQFVELRRAQHPGMHIYHYAPYETTHLLQIAARHGVCEASIDTMLREGLFVDLYPVVRRGLRVGSRSYSIKKLEPLYMGEVHRESEVLNGGDSIVQYIAARAEVAGGDAERGRAMLADIAEYNRDDCVSTLRLRDFLVDLAVQHGGVPSADVEVAEFEYRPSPRAEILRRWADSGECVEADAVALRLAAAALDYYPREAKSFWAAHFLRLREPVTIWAETRDVVVVDRHRSAQTAGWDEPSGRRRARRALALRGDLAPGTRLTVDAQPFAVYELPAPFDATCSPRWIHVARPVTVTEVLEDGAVVEELATPSGAGWRELPVALTPAAPPRAGQQQAAIDEWADAVRGALPGFPADPASDLLRRVPPRTIGEPLEATMAAGSDDIDAIVRGVLALDHSYLAVQGPPGTGKTYVGSHVIARLVRERGYRVGVVAQSHAVVEHLLAKIVAAGVPAAQVAKARKDGAEGDVPFTVIAKNGIPGFVSTQRRGFVVGGTAWDFAHAARVPRGSLDLLVIDEAGQFSLASTIAVAVSAQRLLLLGDPQQLPQVSQGTHPEPVDVSALGWLMGEAQVLPAGAGRFLAQTWRMHPALAAPVSRLSYRGALRAAPVAARRSIEGIEPGLHPVPVRHRGNAVESPEEAAEVVRLVADLLGRAWVDTDPAGNPASPVPLAEGDIIVVTPYNAQQLRVEEALAARGFERVRVGTVDRFQGQEAAVAIVSLAASSGRDAPRGLEFVLLQNRINVSISRAKVAAFLVHSPGLLDDLPRTPDGVARLSAFARLVLPAPAQPVDLARA